MYLCVILLFTILCRVSPTHAFQLNWTNRPVDSYFSLRCVVYNLNRSVYARFFTHVQKPNYRLLPKIDHHQLHSFRAFQFWPNALKIISPIGLLQNIAHTFRLPVYCIHLHLSNLLWHTSNAPNIISLHHTVYGTCPIPWRSRARACALVYMCMCVCVTLNIVVRIWIFIRTIIICHIIRNVCSSNPFGNSRIVLL